MAISERSRQIAQAFTKYVKTKDKHLIENLNLEEIEFALAEDTQDKKWPYYTAMQQRADELKKIKKEKKNTKEKWQDRVIGFIFGAAITIIGVFLSHWLTKK